MKEEFDRAVVANVAIHAVNEDEGEALDALGGERRLFLEMTADQPLELLAKQPGGCARIALLLEQLDPVGKLEMKLLVGEALPNALNRVVAVTHVA